VGPTERAHDGRAATLINPGKAPLRVLRYRLVPGTREFEVQHRLALFDGEQEIGSLDVQAPLTIEVTESVGGYSLSLELGPAHVARQGQADAIAWGGDKGAAEATRTPLRALVNLTPSGTVRTARLDGQAGGALGLLYETLLNLDAPPTAAVGAGARWRTRQNQAGGGWTEAEYDLVELMADRATFRVQRRQFDGRGSHGTRAAGEWSFTQEAWPPTGHDQLTAAVPESGPTVRFSVRFSVTSRPTSAHTRTNEQAE